MFSPLYGAKTSYYLATGPEKIISTSYKLIISNTVSPNKLYIYVNLLAYYRSRKLDFTILDLGSKPDFLSH